MYILHAAGIAIARYITYITIIATSIMMLYIYVALHVTSKKYFSHESLANLCMHLIGALETMHACNQ